MLTFEKREELAHKVGGPSVSENDGIRQFDDIFDYKTRAAKLRYLPDSDRFTVGSRSGQQYSWSELAASAPFLDYGPELHGVILTNAAAARAEYLSSETGKQQKWLESEFSLSMSTAYKIARSSRVVITL